MSLMRFDFASLPVMPWRNGGGETREIASWPVGTQDSRCAPCNATRAVP